MNFDAVPDAPFETALLDRQAVDADAKRTDGERTGVACGDDPLFAGLPIDGGYEGLADYAAGAIGDDASDHAHVLLGEHAKGD